MRGQQVRTVVAPLLVPLLALVHRIFRTCGRAFCHRHVVDRDTTKGGATPPLGTTDPLGPSHCAGLCAVGSLPP
jgi:hypothetical protein